MKLYQFPGALLVICLLFANTVHVAAQDKWSLKRCVDYAMANNISIKQQDVQKRLAELTLKQSQLSQIPNLSGSIGSNYNAGRSVNPTTYTYETTGFLSANASLNTNVTLFNWFSKRNTIASNKYQAQANDFLLEKAKNDVAFNIASSFLQILQNNEQVHVNETQLALTKAQLSNTQKLVAAGSVPESNEADLLAQLARDSANLVTAQNNVILSTLQMKALLNLSFDIPFQPEIPADISAIPLPALNEVDPEMVFSAALTTNPLIRADSLLIKSWEREVAAAKGAMFPTLSLSAGIGTNYANNVNDIRNVLTGVKGDTIGNVAVGGANYKVITDPYPHFTQQDFGRTPFGTQISNNFQQAIGVSLNIPIFNGWQLRAQYKRTKLNLYTQQLTRDQDNLQLRQDIYTAHANAVAAIQKFNAASRGVDASQKAFDFATKRFNLGLMNTIDYITTQNNLFQAQINKVSAQYDFIFRMKLLEFYRDQKITL
ncbi:MAG TPA: TolC family protein [Chitinophaga sp.]|uniref:TolC family protein n=1 Tax=Chitinophaga sp. TaxID=1869181 RepID=UPI002DB75012|nr:TolC family protein [Chitinophaga sp.]HEU4551366.1 TolC family protein [Chitinophaga sp.]